MTAITITGMGLTGAVRITWVQDNLAHVLHHSDTDETSGTWTGLACPGYGLTLGADVNNATLQHLAAARGEIADLIWEAPDELTTEHGQVFQAAIRAHHADDSERAEQLWGNVRAIWSQAWSANYAVLEFFQNTGLTRFAPVKPQHWVAASFEHHTSPHGLPRPHIHNIVLTNMTTAANLLVGNRIAAVASRCRAEPDDLGVAAHLAVDRLTPGSAE
ncbi:MAG: hypothetical protein ACRDOL_08170 [Streptosporangiaceae bacterium]